MRTVVLNIQLQALARGPSLKLLLGCTIASASSARSDFAWALGIYCHLLPIANHLFDFNLLSFNVSCSTLLCVLFSSFCLYESKLKASCVFGDTAEK